MTLIKHGRIVPDPWAQVADDAPLPADGTPALVSLARWQKDRENLLRHNGALGIRLGADQSPALIADDLDRFDLVALAFPKFTDGRAYSYARLLRRRWRFAGEVRAVGNVLRDQLLFMVRCGFDAFETAKDEGPEGFAKALNEIGVFYQPAADDRTPAWQQRGIPARQADALAEARACAGMWAY